MFTLNKVARFRRLTPLERGIFLRAAALLAVVGVGLRLSGFRRVQALLDRGNAKQGRNLTSSESATRAGNTARIVVLAARHGFYRANCLPTSLVLRRLLQRQGIGADLRVGVRKTSGKLEAHAWVEHDGHPLIDGPDVQERFAAFGQPIGTGEEVSR